jgi:hypothetical protein
MVLTGGLFFEYVPQHPFDGTLQVGRVDDEFGVLAL